MRMIPLLLSLVAAPLAAQELILPAGHDVLEGNAIASAFFATGDARHQWVIDRSELQALGQPWVVHEVWFRRDMTSARALAGGVLDVELWASDTNTPPRALSGRFADNRGAAHALCYSGRLTLGTAPASGTVPAAWTESAGQAVRFVLLAPVTGTGNLCLELVTHSVAGQPVPGFWVDAVATQDLGSSRVLGTSCAVGGLTPRTTVPTETLLPGSDTWLRLADVPAGRMVVSLLGFTDQTWAGIPLPLALDQAGAPGCYLYTDWVHVMATVTALPAPGWYSGQAFRRFQLPLDPTLLGGTFYSQWLILEPGINPLGMVTTHGLEARLASAFPAFAIATVESFDPQAASGRVLQHFVPVLRLLP